MDEGIVDLTARITHDLTDFKGWTIRTATDLQRKLQRGQDHEEANTAIVVDNAGTRNLVLRFYLNKPFMVQAVNVLDQLQDAIVETELQPWPVCPEHGDALVPRQRDDDLFWSCVIDENINIRVGGYPSGLSETA